MQETSRYTDYLKSEPAGIYFFSLRLSNAESLYTVLCKPEQGAVWEISCNKFNNRYRKEYTFGFAFENQIPYPIENFFKPLDYNTIAEFLGDDAAKADHFKEAYPSTQLDADIFNNTNISFADNVWDTLKEMFPLFNIHDKERQTPINLITSIVRQLHASLHKDILIIPNNDLEGFNSYYSKEYIKNLKVNLDLSQLDFINDELAETISLSKTESVNLNRLKFINLNQANFLSKNNGNLYLNSIKKIDAEILTALTSGNLKYISLIRLKDITRELDAIIKNSKCFISLQTENKSNKLKKYTYSKEIIDSSVVSDKNKFNKLRSLLFSNDKDLIDHGLSLLSALNDPYAFDVLLEKITLEQEGRYTVVNTDEISNELKLDAATINYVITGILYYAGPESALAEQIKNKITALTIEIDELSFLHCFPGIATLKIIDNKHRLNHLNDLQTLLLRELDISDCTAISDISRLAYFPIEVFRFKNCTRISSFSSLEGKTDASKIKEISLSGFKHLENLKGIEFFQSLEQLNIHDCENLKDISSLNKISKFRSIYGIDERGHLDDFINLPLCKGIPSLFGKNFNKIVLKIGAWNSITGIGSPFATEINISCSGMLNLEWLEGFPNLTHLTINCIDLCDINGLRHVRKLTNLSLSNTSLRDLLGIEYLEALQIVNIRYCHLLKNVDEIEYVLNLKTFDITDCKQLNSIEGWTKNKKTQRNTSQISCFNLPSLIKIGDLSEFYNLKSLYFNHSFNEIILNELKNCASLSYIRIEEDNLKITLNTEVHFSIILDNCGTVDIKNIRFNELIISKMKCNDLTFINSLESTKTIKLVELAELKSIKGINKLSGIEELSIYKCKILSDIDPLKSLGNIKKISLVNLPSLYNISAIGVLPSLESLNIDNCIAIDVKSRARGETELEKVIKYQIKILEFYELNTKELRVKLKNIQETPIPVIETPENNIQKLIELLVSNNLDSIDTALAILEGLRDEKIMNILLQGVSYANGEFRPGKINGECQYYYQDYVLTGLLHCASFIEEWRNFVLRVTELKTKTIDNRYLNQFTNLQTLELDYFEKLSLHLELKQLKSLSIITQYDNPILNLDLLSNCTNLESIDAKEISIENGLGGLKNLSKLKKFCIGTILPNAGVKNDLTELSSLILLEELSISDSSHINSLNGIENCKKITSLKMSKLSISDTFPLKNLHNLKYLEITDCGIESIDLASTLIHLKRIHLARNTKLKTISKSEFAEQIDYFDIRQTGFESFPSLVGVKKILYYTCMGCYKLKDFNALNNIDTSEMPKINLTACPALEDINGAISVNTNELILELANIPKNIKANNINRIIFGKLNDLNGIDQFPNLSHLNLQATDISNTLALKNLQYITKLILQSCTELLSLEGIVNLKKPEVLDIRDTINLRDINSLMEIYPDKIYIHGSLLKKNDFPAHLQEAINWQERS